mmetsp:Transcript_75643/g.225497  ORF Transcript_75643/g.225497 Transcript_75643/m.225497 type:complete len:408 (+) Transcript_75643:59-1282(+)
MVSTPLPVAGGRRPPAAMAITCAMVVLALLAAVVHWVLSAVLAAGIALVHFKLNPLRQQARKADPKVVAVVDVEQPEDVGKHPRWQLDPIADESPSEEKARSKEGSGDDRHMPLGIPGFEKVTNGRSASRSRRRPPDACHRILGDLSPLASGRLASGRSERSTTSLQIIEELQAQIQKLKEEKSNPNTARSERSVTSQKIIDELQAQIQKLKEDKSNLPSARSERSVTSQKIIEDLQAQILRLKEDKSNPPSARSERSEGSQRIIEDLRAQILKLKEEKVCQTPNSARSGGSVRSVKSERSQQIINGLESQISELREELKSVRQSRPTPAMPTTELTSLLRSLQLPEEYDALFNNEGVDFLEDLTDYTESDLIDLGLKRGHARRLLKAATSKDANPQANGTGEAASP